VILRGVKLAVIAAVLAVATATARADDRLLTEQTFKVDPPGALVVDTGFIVGLPAALPTGLSTGIGAGIMHTCGCHLAYGALASWSSASASSETWTVTHDDLRLRATGAIRNDVGRGSLALRLGVGATLVHEDRVRNQGQRAGLSGMDLEQTATEMLPAADLEAVVGLRIFGAWAFQVAAGPTATYFDSHVRGGWTAELGVAWHP
jgi:hypothetical protein